MPGLGIKTHTRRLPGRAVWLLGASKRSKLQLHIQRQLRSPRISNKLLLLRLLLRSELTAIAIANEVVEDLTEVLPVCSRNDLEIFATNGVEDFHLSVVDECPGGDTCLRRFTK